MQFLLYQLLSQRTESCPRTTLLCRCWWCYKNNTNETSKDGEGKVANQMAYRRANWCTTSKSHTHETASNCALNSPVSMWNERNGKKIERREKWAEMIWTLVYWTYHSYPGNNWPSLLERFWFMVAAPFIAHSRYLSRTHEETLTMLSTPAFLRKRNKKWEQTARITLKIR